VCPLDKRYLGDSGTKVSMTTIKIGIGQRDKACHLYPRNGPMRYGSKIPVWTAIKWSEASRPRSASEAVSLMNIMGIIEYPPMAKPVKNLPAYTIKTPLAKEINNHPTTSSTDRTYMPVLRGNQLTPAPMNGVAMSAANWTNTKYRVLKNYRESIKSVRFEYGCHWSHPGNIFISDTRKIRIRLHRRKSRRWEGDDDPKW